MDMKAEIFKKLKYATYDLRASRIGSVSESDNNREVRKFIQARELITSVQSTKYNKNEILEYILEAKKQNYYSVYEIESNGEIVGAIIVHPVHKVIASGGVIDEIEYKSHKKTARSMLVVTKEFLEKIRIPENPTAPIFPAPECNSVSFEDDAINTIRNDFPDLFPGGHDAIEIEKIFKNSARHMLTHGRRAEVIWGYFADFINDGENDFSAIKPEFYPRNGQDGGIDDLRTSKDGIFIATQVKGGTTWGDTTDPRLDARKFFIPDGESQTSTRAKKQREKQYPFLSQRYNSGTLDDYLSVHFLAFGKRCFNDHRIIKGKTLIGKEVLNRTMIVTGLDVVVLSDSIFHGKTRIDMSTASNSSPLAEHLKRKKIISLFMSCGRHDLPFID
ncbi:hypothetical protein [Komagataeibacter sp. FXV3]|uniref:hypothetical protein n=1 Tax=Komagataeibacter sp. FXV3 TaxID=2608998 RepID=UPI00187B4AF6|nr:hypothetical protein [Komagataeibacter sp. FXV3]MBE7731310.1 hypothetical protein [Komagataeibacter sp. FXV3]